MLTVLRTQKESGLRPVRKEVGPKCIISVSFDLHGQMTNQIISNIDAFAAFKTAPHIDVKETYQRSSVMLCKALNDEL